MRSLWQESCCLPTFPKLEKDVQTQVLIIGGGIAGLLCAWQLQEANVPYVLVEANRICSGVTANTTAKITSQHGLIYHDLVRRLGEEMAKCYYATQENALSQYRKLCGDAHCELETKENIVYLREDRERLEKEMRALERIAAKAQWHEKLDLPFPVAGAIGFPDQAQFHPLKFLKFISEKLNIYENSRITHYDGCYHTDHAVIRAEQVVIATHFPIFNKHGLFPLKLHQHRSYVLGLEKARPVDGMYLDGSGKGLSFRMAEDVLLLGGGSHRTGKQGGGWAELEQAVKRYYPEARIRWKWATQDCMSLDGMPYVGQYSPKTPNLYVATGFNKWGMTSAMAASFLLRDLITGKENPAKELFFPSRRMYLPGLAANGFHAAVNLLTPTVPRCPHLGCALKWNRQEHSWDCPCHGSRFAEDGTVLNNPATADMKGKRNKNTP